jgi:hypothetical protein
VELAIYFYNPDRSKVLPEKINIVALYDGKIKYSVNDPKQATLKRIHEEPYQEALKIVSSKNNRFEEAK